MKRARADGTSIMIVPPLDLKPWPTLGPQVCDFIEECLVFGPGDLKGQPAKLDDEKRGLIYRMYEVYPQGDERAGRRRFKRVAISLRKGSAKTELASWITACEVHPRGPVRCVGWDKRGQPIGGPVGDPYIPMVAYTEEQSEELAYGALLAILQDDNCTIGQDFDLGLERIMRLDGSGKAVPLAAAPNSRDGARTTFQHFDETAHMILPRLKKAHRAMLANIPKRRLADAWSLETTTAPEPGQRSVAEDTMTYARAVHEGRVSAPTLFFFHRQASDHHDLKTEKGRRAAVREASGPTVKWSDIDGILDQWKDPTADFQYLERVWLNRPTKSADKAFDVKRWQSLVRPGYVVPGGALITLGFDGSRYEDATAIVGTEVGTGHQWLLRIWEKPFGPEGEKWEVPELEVNEVMDAAFTRWDVWRLYGDPAYWNTALATWSGKYGEKRAVQYPTNRWQRVAYAVRSYTTAITAGELSHDGNEAFERHIANAHRRKLSHRDAEGKPLYLIQKERPDSPLKMDAAMAGCLSWDARTDAIKEGVLNKPAGSIYDDATARPDGFLEVDF